MSHDSAVEWAFGIGFTNSRVARLPIWWHSWQPSFNWLIQSAWLRMFGEMPLPFSPVPGNSLLSGTLIIEYQ